MFPIHIIACILSNNLIQPCANTYHTHTLAPVYGLRKSFYKEKTEVLESTKQKPVQQEREIKPLQGNQILREKQQKFIGENVIPPR
jgi:hypothetical protein